jgi:MraZ protein
MAPSILLLTGEYEHRLDAKHRLFIPSRLRESIDPQRDGLGFYLVFGPNRVLSLYPDEYYCRLAAADAPSLVPPAKLVDFERVKFAQAYHLDLDSHSRVSVPAKMLRRAGLTRDVVLIGVRDHVEIWDAKVWQTYLAEQLDKYEELLELARQAHTEQATRRSQGLHR